MSVTAFYVEVIVYFDRSIEIYFVYPISHMYFIALTRYKNMSLMHSYVAY
jgi:hypothetical protein